jgi:hypothetical protein
MAFPINPSPGDTYTDEYGTVWVYAGPINGWYRQTVIPVNDTTYIGSDGAPGGVGNNTEVVFNDNGSLASDSGLTYNKTTDALSGGAFVPTGSTVPSNGVYLPSANNVAISTNGTGRLFVDASGNVGVGTTSPEYNLDLIGTTTGAFRIRSSTNASRGFELWNNSTTDEAYISNYYNGPIIFQTNNTERARIDSSGRLGLGTSSPDYALDVQTTGTSISSSFTSDQSEQYIALKDSGTTLGHVRLGSTSGSMLFFAGNGERARVDSSGRLLVGTASDSGGALLQVNGNRIRIATAKTPASATDTGTAGEICWDADYVYVCTATNTWKRTAIATW